MNKLALAVLTALAANAAYAGPPDPSGTFSATAASPDGPTTVTITWTSTGAATCTASGSWTGTKALSGTQVISNVNAPDPTYGISCLAATGWADVTWVPPTLNTDNSPLTDLASYKVFAAKTAVGVPTAVPTVVTAPASSYGLTGLSAGSWFVGVQAVNAKGTASNMSALANKVVALPGYTASVTVPIKPFTTPQPPTGVALTVSTLVYEFKNGNVTRLAGTIPLGVECIIPVAQKWGATYYAVPESAVTLDRPLPAGSLPVAECAKTEG